MATNKVAGNPGSPVVRAGPLGSCMCHTYPGHCCPPCCCCLGSCSARQPRSMEGREIWHAADTGSAMDRCRGGAHSHARLHAGMAAAVSAQISVCCGTKGQRSCTGCAVQDAPPSGNCLSSEVSANTCHRPPGVTNSCHFSVATLPHVCRNWAGPEAGLR